MDKLIRSFGAVRPNPYHVKWNDGEWQREEKSISNFTIMDEEGLYSLVGIKTPGLTCAAELGKHTAALAAKYLGCDSRNPRFDPIRRGISAVRELSFDERAALIRDEPDYGQIVCRCREVSLAEVAFDKCLLCTGSRERSIGSLPVGGTRPAGIFTAGTAQKMVNLGGYDIGKRIVILGSGDIGQIMARRFSLLGKEVVAMVEQRSQLGGLARNRRDCIQAFNIPVILNATVDQVLGTGRVSGVMVRHLDTGEREALSCDTLVTALGLIPERELVASLGEPDWLKCLGNCDYIHEIVDTVTAQAEKMLKDF